MAITNLDKKVSQNDARRVKDMRNPPKFEPGFEPSFMEEKSEDDLGFNLDDIFGSSDFSELEGSGFGNDSGQSGFGPIQQGGNQNGFGLSQGVFGDTPNGGFGALQGGLQTGFNGIGQQVQPEPPKPDRLDVVFDALGEASLSLGQVLIETFKSVRNRNADDLGYLSRNMLLTGLGLTAAGVAVGLIGAFNGVKYISFSGFPAHFIAAGILSVGSGLFGLGFAAFQIAKASDEGSLTIPELSNISDEIADDATVDYEDNIGDILNDLFGDSEEDDREGSDGSSVSSLSGYENHYNTGGVIDTPVFAAPIKIDFEEKLAEVRENTYLSREVLFNTFKTFLPCNTPTFADRRDIDENSELFNSLETIALKALCNIAKCELEDVKSHLESATETYFSYELRLKRIRGINKIDDIEREMEAYFRDSSSDTSVNATVDIEGDFYKIIITKGESAVVTFGDVFRQQYACDFVLDTENKLPIITGISELGKVIMDDAKVYDSMLVAGKPRSGKSWYLGSILMMLALFNTPDDVAFIVIDPKESNLFNTFALLPHVLGLHNDKNVLEIMEDIIVNEGSRRKKLLADNKCDDIWALRKKGIKIPVLYLVIDEYITVRNNLGSLDKELDNKLQVIISQLPSQGIRLLFVPHRATGVVNRTNRTMLSFTASVKGDTEDVKDTLGIKQWTRALTKPGDIAIKTSSNRDAMYVRGAALTTSDEANAELIRNAAKAFYKMGVDMPDTSNMRIACNRDEETIRAELSGEVKRIQFNAENVFNDFDNM